MLKKIIAWLKKLFGIEENEIIEIKDNGWKRRQCYLFEVSSEGVKIWPKVLGEGINATADALQDLPDDLRNVMLLCMALPATPFRRDYINVPWREKGVDLHHHMEDGTEKWELAFDNTYTLSEILQEPTT